ncbi:uncharacterized protein [Nicotiana sylvestris]|uniref:uncharacterized protein n=1 Tax=Nicotiana sylvestris TaxID=4096 RepID=UPI00388CE457
MFNYVFLAFKPVVDGFSHCRPLISIDDTHVYGKYDIKLLIVVAVDANGQIFPLAFAICANESQETGILSSVENLPAWQEPYAYHRYCVRHFKANFQKAYPNKDLHDLMWMEATDHQQHKFRMHMEYIRQEDEAAYRWLMRHDPEKWTLHADGGRRWGTLTTNVSESFNGLLKSIRGLLVTAMVRLSFKQMAEKFVERSEAATSLMEKGVEFMPDCYREQLQFLHNMCLRQREVQKESDRIIADLRAKLKEVGEEKWKTQWNCDAQKELQEKYKRELAEVKAKLKEYETSYLTEKSKRYSHII